MATQELTVDSKVQVRETCAECAGNGNWGPLVCKACDGTGRITRWVKLGDVAVFVAGQVAAAVSCEHARPRPAFITTRK